MKDRIVRCIEMLRVSVHRAHIAIRNTVSPMGYEDQDGFHYGREKHAH